MLSLVISRKLSWLYPNVWHRFDDFKAYVEIFGSFGVTLEIGFVPDHKHRYMCQDFYCLLQPIMWFEQTVEDLKGLATALKDPDVGMLR